MSDSAHLDTISSTFLLDRLDRAIMENHETRQRLEIHLTECSARFRSIQHWLRLATIGLIVLFLTVFLHLDLTQIIKLLSPTISLS